MLAHYPASAGRRARRDELVDEAAILRLADNAEFTASCGLAIRVADARRVDVVWVSVATCFRLASILGKGQGGPRRAA